MSHYGKRTVAKDGKTYKSKFEADFVDKFLIPSGLEYVYEVKYKDSKMTCDFWIPKYDIWIECAYHYTAMKHRYEQRAKGLRIYLPKVGFKNKDFVKTQGGQWDPLNKCWWVEYKGRPLPSLHRYMDDADIVTVFESDGKAMIKGYDENLLNKILDRKCNIILVNNDDLDFSNLAHLICAKDNPIVLKNIAAHALNYDRNGGIGLSLTAVHREAEKELAKLVEERKQFSESKQLIEKEHKKIQASLANEKQALEIKRRTLVKKSRRQQRSRSMKPENGANNVQ